jgi:hypothetical protein
MEGGLMFTPRGDKQTIAYLDGMLATFCFRRFITPQPNPYKYIDGRSQVWHKGKYQLYKAWNEGSRDAYIAIIFPKSKDKNL